MANILIMLLLLTGPYAAIRLAGRTAGPPSSAAAAWGAALLFGFTALGHFVQTAQLASMLPAWVPARTGIVYLTGVWELLIAAGLLYAPTRRLAAALAIATLIAFFPANIHAALNRLPFSGNEWGPSYLLVRAPLQAFIVFWLYRWVLRARSA